MCYDSDHPTLHACWITKQTKTTYISARRRQFKSTKIGHVTRGHVVPSIAQDSDTVQLFQILTEVRGKQNNIPELQIRGEMKPHSVEVGQSRAKLKMLWKFRGKSATWRHAIWALLQHDGWGCTGNNLKRKEGLQRATYDDIPNSPARTCHDVMNRIRHKRNRKDIHFLPTHHSQALMCMQKTLNHS